LRTHDLQAPFPEEFNRQVASKITKWHFAPTDFSRQNLLAELVPEARITVTGNTVIDALLWVLGRIDANAQRRDAITTFLNQQLNFDWHSHIVLTDSGGIQEEAPSLGKPVLVMRDVTERPGAVAAATGSIAGLVKAGDLVILESTSPVDNGGEAVARAANEPFPAHGFRPRAQLPESQDQNLQGRHPAPASQTK